MSSEVARPRSGILPRLYDFIDSLRISAQIAPAAAAAITVTAYLLLPVAENVTAVWLGIGGALVIWTIAAIALYGMNCPERANPISFVGILERRDELRGRIEAAQARDPSKDTERALRCATIIAHLNWIDHRLGEVRSGTSADMPRVSWLFATGYLELWARIHRAEEDLIMVESISEVIGGAAGDRMRLTRLEIEDRAALIRLIDGAFRILRGQRGPVAYEGADPALIRDEDQGNPTLPAAQSEASSTPESMTQEDARAILRTVRYALHCHRDDLWASIVRTRNHLLLTTTSTGVVSYLLLMFAVFLRPPIPAMAAAVALYLVGAAVGLFKRLYDDANAEKSVEDYGLSIARLAQAPLLSGLAGVGGVYLLAMLAGSPISTAVSPIAALPRTVVGAEGVAATSTVDLNQADTPPNAPDETTEAVQSQKVTPPYPALGAIFNLDTYPFGLVLAAVFGLVPSLLLNRLQGLADQYTTELKASELASRSA